MYRLTYVIPVALALMLSACLSSPAEPEVPTIEETTFAPSLNIDLSEMTITSSGLYYRDLEVGDDTTAAAGMEVSVRYSGWLADGTLFDSNQEAENPFTFLLGVGRVIPGFDEGVIGMQTDGERQIIIPPHLGYGNQPVGSIPANSILVFEVRLVDVVNEDEVEA